MGKGLVCQDVFSMKKSGYRCLISVGRGYFRFITWGFGPLFCLANSPKSDMKKAMVDEPNVTINQAYLKTMEKKVEDLRVLIEVSAIISSTLDFCDLMNLVMEKAKKHKTAQHNINLRLHRI